MSSDGPAAGALALRPARPEEATRLAAIAEAAYARYLARMDRRPAPMDADYAGAIAAGHAAVLADADDRAVGFLIQFPRAEDWFVENVAVDPALQGGGLGRRLMAEAERAARAAGRTRVRLYTNVAMTENIPFYEALGYRVAGRVREDGFERIYFEKDLPEAAERNGAGDASGDG
ncbi:MAG: GNAT family N-acetyltransferase [Alphaproteobacteria bacterium]|nr:GNAT family N-acetyltransferase [Alphaproteobacteria bacterium]